MRSASPLARDFRGSCCGMARNMSSCSRGGRPHTNRFAGICKSGDIRGRLAHPHRPRCGRDRQPPRAAAGGCRPARAAGGSPPPRCGVAACNSTTSDDAGGALAVAAGMTWRGRTLRGTARAGPYQRVCRPCPLRLYLYRICTTVRTPCCLTQTYKLYTCR